MEAMNATLLDERQYRKLLEGSLPVAIRTEEEYHRLLGAAADLMEEGRLLELLSTGILTHHDAQMI